MDERRSSSAPTATIQLLAYALIGVFLTIPLLLVLAVQLAAPELPPVPSADALAALIELEHKLCPVDQGLLTRDDRHGEPADNGLQGAGAAGKATGQQAGPPEPPCCTSEMGIERQ